MKKEFKKYVIVLLLTINNVFPCDKVAIILLNTLYGSKLIFIPTRLKLVVLLFFLNISIGYFFNFSTASFRVFYPLLFFLGAILLSNDEVDLKKISLFFLPNIGMGIFGVFYSLLFDFEPNNFVVFSAGKSVIFPICATGFSPTPQVYGTFCVLYIWACLEKKKIDFGFLLSIIGILLSQNRTSYVFVLLILFLYKRKWFIFLTIGFVLILLSYNDLFADLGNTNNLDSRALLRHGFELQYWKSNDLLTYIVGIGNNQVDPQYGRFNTDSRAYIENGLDFILAVSGIIGLLFYIITVSLFVSNLLRKRKVEISLIFIFYMFVNQWMTQEFLASSFFFFILFVIRLSKEKEVPVATGNNLEVS